MPFLKSRKATKREVHKSPKPGPTVPSGKPNPKSPTTSPSHPGTSTPGAKPKPIVDLGAGTSGGLVEGIPPPPDDELLDPPKLNRGENEVGEKTVVLGRTREGEGGEVGEGWGGMEGNGGRDKNEPIVLSPPRAHVKEDRGGGKMLKQGTDVNLNSPGLMEGRGAGDGGSQRKIKLPGRRGSLLPDRSPSVGGSSPSPLMEMEVGGAAAATTPSVLVRDSLSPIVMKGSGVKNNLLPPLSTSGGGKKKRKKKKSSGDLNTNQHGDEEDYNYEDEKDHDENGDEGNDDDTLESIGGVSSLGEDEREEQPEVDEGEIGSAVGGGRKMSSETVNVEVPEAGKLGIILLPVNGGPEGVEEGNVSGGLVVVGIKDGKVRMDECIGE
ncbi:hypothetical protein TrRE_jg12074 [Triparma retinervis]|uniref:Uncharacterized protein n=1 Tax=Triparma retinervis TaxID=2557542 RepID=A0A9W7DNA5_9STRA|nr:hypothetical protein TrRE_jg12074 [Triparma retinervis]